MRRALLGALMGAALLAPPAMASVGGHGHGGGLRKVDHFVVIYEENHSFDNLYGGWERVNGLRDADRSHTRQVNQAGTPYECLLQNDVNLTSPPLSARCANTAPAFSSHFANEPFRIEDYIAPEDTTCPKPGMSAPFGVVKGSGEPGGCTRDLVHRFYQEQYPVPRVLPFVQPGPPTSPFAFDQPPEYQAQSTPRWLSRLPIVGAVCGGSCFAGEVPGANGWYGGWIVLTA